MSRKQRNIRKRRALDEQEELSEDEAQGLSVQDTKLLQKQRQRKTVRVGLRPRAPALPAPALTRRRSHPIRRAWTPRSWLWLTGR